MGAGASSTRAADISAGINTFANATDEDAGTGMASSGQISDADAVRLPERVCSSLPQDFDDVSAIFQMDPDIVGTHRSHERIERLHRHFICFLPEGASPVYLAGAEGCGSLCILNSKLLCYNLKLTYNFFMWAFQSGPARLLQQSAPVQQRRVWTSAGSHILVCQL